MTIMIDEIAANPRLTVDGMTLKGKPCHNYDMAIIRGGRIIKRNGLPASVSPEHGVSAVDGPAQDARRDNFVSKALHALRWSSAPMAILASSIAITNPAAAQDACVSTGVDQVTCEDNGAAATTPQTASGGNLFVTLENGFGVNSAGGPGLEVTATGSVSLTGAGGTSSITGTTGLSVSNVGMGAVSIVTSGPITGTTGTGIYAYNAGTDLTIDSSTGTVSGGTNGISATNYGSGALRITAANVIGAGGDGVYAYNSGNGTDLTIDTSRGTVSGRTDGIDATNAGSGSLSITTANVSGTTGLGIRATNYGTNLTVNSRAGTVSGATGVSALNYGTGTLSVTTANATGTSSAGIYAYNAGTDLTIDSSAGAVIGATDGISAANYGTGALAITTDDVTGTARDGVYAYNAGTSLTIDTSAGTVSGRTDGIDATNAGSGSLSIIAAGVTAGDGIGISASVGANSTGLAITTTGTVAGAQVGIDARNGSTSATIIVNNGVITASSREAIRAATTASALITNNGRIEGFVTLGAGNDRLTNTGTIAAIGNSDFGAGTDLLTNSGTLVVQGTGAVSFTGLENFANSGQIELANGIVGNNLTLSGNFTGSGNSALTVDVDFAARTADRFTIAGAATGSTSLTLNVIGGQSSGLIDRLVIIDAGTGSTTDAFALVGGRQVNGFIEYGISFDAGTNDFLLSSAPSIAAYEFSNFGDLARNAWTQSANAFSDHMTMTRDTGAGDGARGWITGYGSNLDRERSASTTFNGLASTYNLGYSQDSYGFLAGVDFGTAAVRYGVTGGYQNSEADFDGSVGGVGFDVFSLGGYIAADFESFWVNALVKYDTISGVLENPAAELATDFDGSVFGAQVEVGALVGNRDSLFLEPRVSLAYSGADLDDITVLQGSLSFDPGESLLGKVGGRAGTGLDLGGKDGVVYVAGHYVHEFEGNDTVLFGTGQSEVLIGNLPVGDYAELSTGIAVGGDDDAFAASLQGTIITGSDIEGYGATLNLRYRFYGSGR